MKKALTIMALSFFLVTMTIRVAKADGWVPPGYIIELAAKGDGDIIIRHSQTGSGYDSGAWIYLYYDPNDPKINNPKHIKTFLSQLMMAYSLRREIAVEVYERNITIGDGSVITAWVMQSLRL